jgi:hypothetical protein
MIPPFLAAFPSPALVARTEPSETESYLLVTPAGRAIWTSDPEEATAFASMREAARMAVRLPASLRAFGLPREPELAVQGLH